MPKTHDRQQVLNYVIAYKHLHDGNSPSLREIVDACGLGSVSTANSILDELEQVGMLRTGRDSRSRSIEIVGGYCKLRPTQLAGLAPDEYVRREIERIFIRLADEHPDAHPMQVFEAQTFMLSAWAAFMERVK